MQPILNFLESLVDKYIIHIPDEKKKQFRDDAIDAARALAEAAKEGAPVIAEAAAKGAVEGAKS